MKLYVCRGTWKPAPRRGGYACGRASARDRRELTMDLVDREPGAAR
jgi:hypothetical protein